MFDPGQGSRWTHSTAQHGNFYCLSRPAASSSVFLLRCASPPPNSKPQSRRNPLPAREISSRFSAHGSLNSSSSCSLARSLTSTQLLAWPAGLLLLQSIHGGWSARSSAPSFRSLLGGCTDLPPKVPLSSRRIEFFLKFRVFVPPGAAPSGPGSSRPRQQTRQRSEAL